jgi:2-(1,2-epoxy-1,2-dihydrophenyl)acetyl-CoA isomerase
MTNIDTGSPDLIARRDGHVAILSLNRPDSRNAFSDSMFDGFAAALPAIAADQDIWILLLTGEGGAFCAGGDVKAMNQNNNAGAGLSSETRYQAFRRHQATLSVALRQLPQPVVAALPGAAVGAGLSMALAADLRIAAERALIITGFANVAVSGDFGLSWFLPRLIGESKAKELFFCSPRLSARQAADLGIINVVLPDEEFEAAALQWCHELAERAPVALRYMKQNINRAFEVPLDKALDGEAIGMTFTMQTNDHREAAAAFVEKRLAVFVGK